MSSSRFGTFVQNVLCCDLQSYFLCTVRAEHVSESVKEGGGRGSGPCRPWCCSAEFSGFRSRFVRTAARS